MKQNEDTIIRVVHYQWNVDTTKKVDGHMTYRVEFNSLTEITEGNQTFIGKEVDYAYKQEVMEWIETGNFEYNEDLTFNN